MFHIAKKPKCRSLVSLALRGMNDGDCRSIWLWANDAKTRNASLCPHPILWSEHILWFERLLQTEPLSVAIIEIGSAQSIAIVRCAVNGYSGELSLNICPTMRGCGLGKRVLALAIPHFIQLFELEYLTAKIKPFNSASLHIFRQLGFVTLNRMDLPAPRYLTLVKMEKSSRQK